MNADDLKKGIVDGALGGAISGWIALAMNLLSGALAFESSILQNLIAFAVGGAVFGIVVGGFLGIVGDLLPFEGAVPKAILISTGLWVVLRCTGFLLTLVQPDRYHVDILQTVQGFLIAVVMGAVIGLVWNRSDRDL